MYLRPEHPKIDLTLAARFLLPGRVWFEYFVICKVRVNANFLRFNICVWRASKLSLLVLGRFNYYCLRT